MNVKAIMLLAMTAFAVLLVTARAETSVVSGVVFVDNDMNGEWDHTDEWVLPNFYMRITAHGDPTYSREVATDQYGRFQFDDLSAGVYDIEQIRFLPEYISATIEVGTLVDFNNSPLGSGYGVARQYDQSTGTMPAVLSIVIPDETTIGTSFNFGQIWWGKFMYVSEPPDKPPGARPPEVVIPEPSVFLLLAVGAVCLPGCRRTTGRRRRTGRRLH